MEQEIECTDQRFEAVVEKMKHFDEEMTCLKKITQEAESHASEVM